MFGPSKISETVALALALGTAENKPLSHWQDCNATHPEEATVPELGRIDACAYISNFKIDVGEGK